LNEIIGQNNSV